MTDFEVHKVGTSDEIERLRAMTAASMGVGDGNGQLFVHGDYASIKAAQEIVFRMERAEAERDALRADAERYRWLRANNYGGRSERDTEVERLVDALRRVCEAGDEHWENVRQARKLMRQYDNPA